MLEGNYYVWMKGVKVVKEPVSLYGLNCDGWDGLKDTGEVLDHVVDVCGQASRLPLYVLDQCGVNYLKYWQILILRN